jgi:uncharacterized protein (UPF0264 family)
VRLLVSVSNAVEALSALDGGADIDDAKDPTRGALEAVSLSTFAAIHRACAGQATLTAALGDTRPGHSEPSAVDFARAGASFVKIGFADATSPGTIASVLETAIHDGGHAGASPCGVIAVAYADADRVSAAAPQDVLAAAVGAGAAGVLLDTADKNGPGLCSLWSRDALARWVTAVRRAGLLVAVAGRLSADDLAWLAPMDIDIAGVRGAACEAGRSSAISAPRVRTLRARCRAMRPQ